MGLAVADGVQVGSRFAASMEASGHNNFKQSIVHAGDGGTKLTLKQLVPVRMIKNDFFNRVEAAEHAGASREQLAELLGRGRAKRGMFEGNLEEGELEIGQVSAMIDEILPVSAIMSRLITEFNESSDRMHGISFPEF